MKGSRRQIITKSYVAMLSPMDRRRYTHTKNNGEIVRFTV